MSSITQAEFYKRFEEYLKGQKCEETIELKRQQWYTGQLFKFDKMIKDEGIEVRAGFYVDNTGKTIYESDEK
jgi:hypothetical protein